MSFLIFKSKPAACNLLKAVFSFDLQIALTISRNADRYFQKCARFVSLNVHI